MFKLKKFLKTTADIFNTLTKVNYLETEILLLKRELSKARVIIHIEVIPYEEGMTLPDDFFEDSFIPISLEDLLNRIEELERRAKVGGVV